MKLSRYPSLALYLKHKHPELFELCEILDVYKFIASSSRFLTFLSPDKKVLGEIKKQMKDDPSGASLSFSSYFIPLLLCTSKDFDDHKDELYTIAGYKLNVKKVTSKEVTIEENAVISDFDKACVNYFNTAYTGRGGFAVYNITGTVKPDLTKRREIRSRRRNPREEEEKKTVGSFDDVDLTILRKEREIIVKEYLSLCRINLEEAKNHLHSCVTRIVSYVLNNHSIDPECLATLRILKCIGCCDTTKSFFLFLYYEKLWIYTNLLHVIVAGMKYDENLRSYEEFIDFLDPDSPSALLNPEKIDQLMDKRDSVLLYISGIELGDIFIKEVKKMYNELTTKNRLEDLPNIFPNEYFQFIQTSGTDLLAARDEIIMMLEYGNKLSVEDHVKWIEHNVLKCFIPSLLQDTPVYSLLDNHTSIAISIVQHNIRMYTLHLVIPKKAILERSQAYAEKGKILGEGEKEYIIDVESADLSQTLNRNVNKLKLREKIEGIISLYTNKEDITDDLRDLLSYV